jgi:ElaB/YqjD/DUF883 family membrane-anchored ribosome-binding protein
MERPRGEAVRPAGVPMVPMPELRPHEGGAAGAVEETKEAGLALASEVADAGGQIGREARERAKTEVDRRSSVAGERVASAADDVRDVAEHLRQRGKEQPARLADDAAERIERFAEYLRDADTDTIIADVRDFGRRQPAVVIAAAAVVGIVAGRLLKASDPGEVVR